MRTLLRLTPLIVMLSLGGCSTPGGSGAVPPFIPVANTKQLMERVIDPAVRRAGETFLANLDAITVEQMCETAEKTHVLDDEKVSGDFAI